MALHMLTVLLIIIEGLVLIPLAWRAVSHMEQNKGALLMAALLRDDYEDGFIIEPKPTPRPTLEPVDLDTLPVTPMPEKVE